MALISRVCFIVSHVQQFPEETKTLGCRAFTLVKEEASELENIKTEIKKLFPR
jgi:hypothetical protein